MEVNRTFDAIGLEEETILRVIPYELDRIEIDKKLEILVTDEELAKKISKGWKRAKFVEKEEREDRIAVLLERSRE
ncbi:MAG: hypothetical protein K9W43_12985 [Candidatus Thorarchaeota archaeon]|nr:hypothetical protein [Candidatus Thorarchaeota archaeon]